MVDDTKVTIGIIGGCLAAQPGIPHSKLYHKRLIKLLDEGMGIEVGIVLAKDSHSSYTDRLAGLLQRRQLDAVLLHIRPTTCHMKRQCLVTMPGGGKSGRIINPLLLRRSGESWHSRKGHSTTDAAGRGVGYDHGAISPRRRGLMVLNCLLGVLLGAHRLALRNERHLVKEMHTACKREGIQLYILGPTPARMTPLDDWICRSASQSIEALAKELGIAYTAYHDLLTPEHKHMLNADMLHLTEDGHEHMAKVLYQLFQEEPLGMDGRWRSQG